MPANHLLRVPSLRRKSTGNHFVRFWVDGKPKDHSLGTDPALAQLRYKEALARWAAGREAPPTAEPTPTLRVAELARMMLDSYLAKGRLGAERGFRKHLTRFLQVHGAAEVLALTQPAPEHGRFAPPIIRLLEALAEDLGRPTATTGRGVAHGGPYAPRTINHDLAAARRLFNWGAARGFCPPIAWHGLHRVKVPRSQPEDLTPAQVRAMIAKAQDQDPRLAPYLALQYLCLLRPTEAIRLVLWKKLAGGRAAVLRAGNNQGPTRLHRSDASATFGNAVGRFLAVKDQHGRAARGPGAARGLFELFIHKNAWRRVEETDGRYIVLTDEALHWFDLAQPVWSHPSNLTRASTLVCGFPPHVLRDSGASHLRALGAGEEDVDRLLGHCRPGELLTYARVPWHALRASAARLTLQPGTSPRRRSS